MVSSVTNALVQAVQVVTSLLASLHITAPLWPKGVEVSDGATFDFIVVGAGTAGSAIAARLAEVRDCSVLLIEAGGDPPLTSVVAGAFPLLSYSEYDWKFKSEYDPNFAQGHKEQVLNLTTGKMLGGSSSLNHLIYSRGFPHDYNRWAEVVNDESWNYENIFKYLLKTERLEDKQILHSEFVKYHGTNGTIGTSRETKQVHKRYLDAYKDVGYEVLLDSANGKLAFSDMLFMVTETQRQSTAKTYLIDQIEKKKRTNVSILKNTLVTKVLFDNNKVAKGVTALTKDDKEVSYYASKEVILSAGTFNSPQLLQLSGIGPKTDLEKLNIPVIADLPVGENYQDHPMVLLGISTQKLPLLPVIPNIFEFPSPAFTGYVALNKSQPYPDYQQINLIIQSKLAFSLACSAAFSYSNHACDSFLRETIGDEFLLLIPSFLTPISRGKVSLRSTDPKEPPIIRTGMLTEQADRDKVIDIIEDALSIENSEYFKNTNAKLVEVDLPECKRYEFRSREYWGCYLKYMTGTTYHYSSTCSMGSVVDNELKVIGLKNIRVVDCSVMPYISTGNTEIPVLVIAEKAADMIKATYGYTSCEETNDSNDSNDDGVESKISDFSLLDIFSKQKLSSFIF